MGQRDFFDRRVQNNVTSAVSQYNNYGGYGGNLQKPSYSSSQRTTSFKNAPNLNKMNMSRAKRGKPSDSQLKTYEAAADRDVLCWIFENQGKCRYGAKCQWLHLDRETGQYVPTVYIMNSLDSTPYKKDKNDKEDDNKKEDKPKDKETNINNKDEDNKKSDEEDKDIDPQEL